MSETANPPQPAGQQADRFASQSETDEGNPVMHIDGLMPSSAAE
jgi:hypothetical protein